jgi:hypothetical protein
MKSSNKFRIHGNILRLTRDGARYSLYWKGTLAPYRKNISISEVLDIIEELLDQKEDLCGQCSYLGTRLVSLCSTCSEQELDSIVK